jgi:hypothetical protein
MNLVDRLLNFFFSPSRALSSDLTWRIFVWFNSAGRTQLQRKPKNSPETTPTLNLCLVCWRRKGKSENNQLAYGCSIENKNVWSGVEGIHSKVELYNFPVKEDTSNVKTRLLKACIGLIQTSDRRYFTIWTTGYRFTIWTTGSRISYIHFLS